MTNPGKACPVRPGPQDHLMRWILPLLIRGVLRGFSTPTLYQLHARAGAELSPEAARTARTLIADEVSRRTRKDY